MNQNDMSSRRNDARLAFKKGCTLSKTFKTFDIQTVDISKWGLGVMVNDETMYFERGDTLFVYIKSMQHSSKAEVCWIKKDKDSTRVGLSLLTSLFE